MCQPPVFVPTVTRPKRGFLFGSRTENLSGTVGNPSNSEITIGPILSLVKRWLQDLKRTGGYTLRALIPSLVVATFLATVACQDSGPAGLSPISKEALSTIQTYAPSGYQDRRLANATGLEAYSDILQMIDPGQCLIEYVRGNGAVIRYVRTLPVVEAKETEPFGVEYKLKGGRVPYRATCDVPYDGRKAAMDAISWAPGKGTHAAGKGWRGQAQASLQEEGSPEQSEDPPSGGPGAELMESQINLPVSRSVDLDPYSNYDWCYVLLEGSEIVDVLYCGYDTDPDSCELEPDGFSGECRETSGGSGGGESPEPTDLPCDPVTDPDCEVPLTPQDTLLLNSVISQYARTGFTDGDRDEKCSELLGHFQAMLAGGEVFRGAYDTDPDDPNVGIHEGAWDPNTGHIHFDPHALDEAAGPDTYNKKNLLNTALHEAAHDLGYTHSPSVYLEPWGYMYAEVPFSYLHPDPNSCVVW